MTTDNLADFYERMVRHCVHNNMRPEAKMYWLLLKNRLLID